VDQQRVRIVLDADPVLGIRFLVQAPHPFARGRVTGDE
jgi:hypothetical protein